MASYLEALGESLELLLIDIWGSFRDATPGILMAIVIIVVGYIVASAFGLLFHRFLITTKVDHHLKKAGLAHSIGFINVASLGGALMKWWLVSVALTFAVSFLQLGTISDLLSDFAKWLPSLFVSIIIMLAGLVFADFVADRMLHAKRKGVRFTSSIVRWFIIIFVALIAIEEIGVNVSFATNSILLIVAGLSVGVALAVGIGFGLALKDEARGVIKQIKKNF